MQSSTTTSSDEVPIIQYDPSENKWIERSITLDQTKLQNISELIFLTYNIWFSPHNFTERGIELRNIMQSSNADFICLQEVTYAFYTALLQCEWARGYYISNHYFEGYTTLILSKHPCKFRTKKWPSHMGRSLLYAQLNINDKSTAVGTVHLESLGNSKRRKSQLEITFEEFKPYDIAFLMGDFNFDWESENQNILPEYKDVWKMTHPSDPGYTMPKSKEFPAWRPDKILVKAENYQNWNYSIHRVGMDPIPKYSENREVDHKEDFLNQEFKTPSDHYGLLSTLLID